MAQACWSCLPCSSLIKKKKLQNRRILEDLNQKKQQLMLKQQSSIPSGSVNGAGSSQNAGHAPVVAPEIQPMTSSQRAALQHAHANSVGFFMTQDSSFGNLILPVLPRFDK